MPIKKYASRAVKLLMQLISIPSISREEDKTADLIAEYLQKEGYKIFRKHHNVWVRNKHFSEKKPTILLNSHHDTVKPNEGWLLDPFKPTEKNGKIYGLGSNDAGASLVSLLMVFLMAEEMSLPFNLIYAATAEEEISGKNGVESILEELGSITLGIVGEPTGMQMAIAEKGLMVLDCTAQGMAGHAARNEGLNAIYEAMEDIEWFRTFRFPEVSPLLGEVKMTVTQIEAGKQHNVVPDTCCFVVDVRTNELYTNEEVFHIIQQHVSAKTEARSFRLNSSSISPEHPIVKAGLELGLNYYGSPTMSDQALMRFPTIKIGVGDSARSHTADEYIYPEEIEEGIRIYSQLLKKLH